MIDFNLNYCYIVLHDGDLTPYRIIYVMLCIHVWPGCNTFRWWYFDDYYIQGSHLYWLIKYTANHIFYWGLNHNQIVVNIVREYSLGLPVGDKPKMASLFFVSGSFIRWWGLMTLVDELTGRICKFNTYAVEYGKIVVQGPNTFGNEK